MIAQTMLERAGIGRPAAPTGRHPIEVLAGARWSKCTDIAVRTHIPVRVGLGVVLVPIDEADRVIRGIARQAWPDDPSPLEEDGYRAGFTATEAMCLEVHELQVHVRYLRHLLTEMDEAAFQQRAALVLRMAEVVKILQSFREDDEARQEAFKVLTGTELLIQFGEAGQCGSC